MQKYVITLADGRQLTDLTKNGDNFVSKTKVDEAIFENNLSTMKISDGKTETVLTDAVFIQQMEWADGSWYLAFREPTEQERRELSYQNRIAELEEALDMILKGVTEDAPGAEAENP